MSLVASVWDLDLVHECGLLGFLFFFLFVNVIIFEFVIKITTALTFLYLRKVQEYSVRINDDYLNPGFTCLVNSESAIAKMVNEQNLSFHFY